MHYATSTLVRADHGTATCTRCGITRKVHTSRPDPGLCCDCRTVTRDLGEYDRWAR